MTKPVGQMCVIVAMAPWKALYKQLPGLLAGRRAGGQLSQNDTE